VAAKAVHDSSCFRRPGGDWFCGLQAQDFRNVIRNVIRHGATEQRVIERCEGDDTRCRHRRIDNSDDHSEANDLGQPNHGANDGTRGHHHNDAGDDSARIRERDASRK
jgi:hypothetical protein